MIEFVSLFLGLVLGVQNVEVAVGEGVAAVELRLDNAVVATLEGPAWSQQVDFGLELLPRRFEAVALDAAGGQLDTAIQWLNLPQDPAAGRVVIEGPPHERVASLTWESTAGALPRQVRASFDGQPLNVEDPRRIALPPHDPGQLHFLRIELEFSRNVTSITELSFGGTFADEISTEITALPIALGKGRDEPSLAELAGAFSKNGEPLLVSAIEKGPAEVVLVVASSFGEAMRTMQNRQLRTLPGGANNPSANQLSRTSASRRNSAALRQDQRVRFLYPYAVESQGVEVEYRLFPTSPEYSAEDGGVHYLLSRQLFEAQEERLADAVAVAGLSSAGHLRRRTVVLILGEGHQDASQFTPEMARSYLKALRVPLVVWYPGKKGDRAAAAWGEVVDVATRSKLDGAVNRLSRDLERQWIVWIDGTHLPQEIELTGEIEGVRLLP